MKLATITIKDFRRFTDLKIQNLPEPTRLIMLAGPNGCGKSSLFDAFAIWHRSRSRPQENLGWDSTYHSKSGSDILRSREITDQVQIEFHDERTRTEEEQKKLFYIRSAYRNDPEFQTNTLRTVGSVLDEGTVRRLIENDATVSKNYSRMVSNSLQDMYEYADPDERIRQFRERTISEVRQPFARLFPEMELNSLSNPLENGTFRFTKGSSKGFEFKNPSGGEKAAFDLILDIAVRRKEYNNTVFCIDEPESHMNARLQAELLQVLYDLIPTDCQLVMATHSVGMMRRARDIGTKSPESVVFLDFGGRDFDQGQIIEPATPSRNFWHGIYQIALDDLAALVAPSRVVICEGSPASAGNNHSHDALCYDAIFREKYPETRFVSMGNDQQIIGDQRGLAEALGLLISGLNVIRLVDRDDRTSEEVKQLQQKGVRALSWRNLESYLYDDEVLTALAHFVGQPNKIGEILQAKKLLLSSTSGPQDDLKQVSGQLFVECRKILQLNQRGNNEASFSRDTLSTLIKPGMAVYDQLEQDIFSS